MRNRLLKTLGYTLIVPTSVVISVVLTACLTFDIPLTLGNLLEVLSRSTIEVGMLYTSAFYVFYNITKYKGLN